MHYWSPEIQVRIEPDEFCDENTTLIKCLVGPRSAVWGLFAFFYAATALLSLFGGIYGLSKWHLGQESFYTWLLPIGVGCIALIFLLAKVGRMKGKSQMIHLIDVVITTANKTGYVKRAYYLLKPILNNRFLIGHLYVSCIIVVGV